MAETCKHCHLVHDGQIGDDAVDAVTVIHSIEACIAAQKVAMRALLQKIGKQVACGGCGASIYFVLHSNGKRVPYTEAGLNHFVDCPARDQFKRPKV